VYSFSSFAQQLNLCSICLIIIFLAAVSQPHVLYEKYSGRIFGFYVSEKYGECLIEHKGGKSR
jgi:hypothetical protein